MSDFAQALLISGGIFAVMMVSQFGRRSYSWHRLVLPLAAIGYFGYAYLVHAPGAAADIWLYLVGAGIGAVCAVLATITTGVEKDQDSGKIYTRTALPFLLVWLVAMLARVAFVWAVTDVGWFRNDLGAFMFAHGLSQDAIAPFFVIWALVMVLGRIAGVGAKAMRLRRTTESDDIPTLAG